MVYISIRPGCNMSQAASGRIFSVLPQNGEHPVNEFEADGGFGKAIAETVEAAIAETATTVKKGVSPAKYEHVKTRSTGRTANRNGTMDAATIGEIVCQVVASIQPMKANVVTAAVSASTKQIVAEMKAAADTQAT